MISLKRIYSILVLLLAFVSAASALDNNGGVYERVTNTNQIKDGDVIIIASWAKTSTDNKSRVRIMTTASSDHPGYFGFYTYGTTTCDSYASMPSTIVLNSTNADGMPYEYVVENLEDTRNYKTLSIKNRDGMYLIGSKTSSYSLTLSESSKEINAFYDPEEPKLIINYASGNSRSLRCVNYQFIENTNAFFTNTGSSANYNYPIFYRKVATPLSLTFGGTGYATTYYGENDIILPSGVKAYTYDITDGSLAISYTMDGDDNEKNIIPHATAVVLKGTPNQTYTLGLKASVESTATLPGGIVNLLKGSDEEAQTTGENSKFYILANGNNGLGFYYGVTGGAAFTSGAHKAYLTVPTATASKPLNLALPTDDNATGITITEYSDGESMESQPTDAAMAGSKTQYYDLLGRATSRPSQGLHILNGRKYTKK